MNNIIIIGGGTAGWLTAIFAKKYCKNSNVKLIESTEIGILGAGEGSTPNLVNFLSELEIDEKDLLEKVNGTKKLGIHFHNWSNIEYSYVHGFGDRSEEDESVYAYHFDARLLANYLKEIAIIRGVEYIDGKIKNIEQNEKGDISNIKLENNINYDTNFVFDCSGFYRLTPKLFKLKWKTYTNELMVNTAIPFFLKRNDITVNTRTNAIAMDYGWVWQIPLKNRWGCGYIFDKKLISEDTAKTEIINKFGNDIQINKTIDFQPGTYEKTLINNCLIVGLSSGFLEPLEATSIMTIVVQLKTFKKYLNNTLTENEFNKSINNIQRQNMIVIRHHYNCSKNDTTFWKKYKEKKLPKELEKIVSNKNLMSIKNNTELKKALNVPKSTKLQFPIESYELINNGNFPKQNITLI
jgi:tryptophan halogenase